MPTVEVSSPTQRVTDPGSSLVCSHNITKADRRTSMSPKTVWAAKRAAALEDFIPQHEVQVPVSLDVVLRATGMTTAIEGCLGLLFLCWTSLLSSIKTGGWIATGSLGLYLLIYLLLFNCALLRPRVAPLSDKVQ